MQIPIPGKTSMYTEIAPELLPNTIFGHFEINQLDSFWAYPPAQ